MTTTAAGVGIGLLAGFTHLITRSRTRLLVEQAEEIANTAHALLRNPPEPEEPGQSLKRLAPTDGSGGSTVDDRETTPGDES